MLCSNALAAMYVERLHSFMTQCTMMNLPFPKRTPGPSPQDSSPDTINNNPSGNSGKSTDENPHRPMINTEYGRCTTSLSA